MSTTANRKIGLSISYLMINLDIFSEKIRGLEKEFNITLRSNHIKEIYDVADKFIALKVKEGSVSQKKITQKLNKLDADASMIKECISRTSEIIKAPDMIDETSIDHNIYIS